MLFLNSAFGISFEKYEVVCDVDANNNVHETITLSIFNNNSKDIKDITYIVPQTLKNLEVYSDRGVKSYSKRLIEGATEIYIELENPIKKNEHGEITLEFDTDNLVWDKENGEKLLSISVPAVRSKFELSIKLPPGAAVVSPQGFLSITPQGYVVDTDGRRIVIKWKKELEDEKSFTATVAYAIITKPVVNNTLTYGFAGVSFLLAVSLLCFMIATRKNKLYKNRIEDLQKELENLSKTLEKKDNEVKKLSEINKLLNNDLKNANMSVEAYKKEVIKKDKEIEKIKEEYEKCLRKVEELKKELLKIDELKDDVDAYKELSERYKKELESLKDSINRKDEYIKMLENKIKEYESNRRDILMNVLTDEEKEIINLIGRYGSITQKEIVEITGMTKPKVSRLVSDLEQRGIVKKMKIGRINKLVLSEDVLREIK
ncbi:helix-turn-helix transcriptional regulator [Methanotorris formicicus]|uniref:Transcriptional regulator, MarR family n=1 Tax=Methanotorris formicicus Mc-S-70 TaxID=647171 RepID=H1L011_9EURY|nr:MarR family transcriptional regulator [Methanotorris formicicus]EHP85309.1 transcriptional regulator, MarR family [Methanotorris formicicus Mc-S-70]